MLTSIAFAGIGFTGFIGEGIYFNRDSGDGALILNPSGVPTNYLAAKAPNARGDNTGTAVLVDASGTVAGGDRVILGTWSSATWNDTPSSNPSTAQTVTPFNFVAGQVTPEAYLPSISGQRGEYAFTAATPVFSSANSSVVGSVMPSSKLTVDFLGLGNFVDVSLDVLFPAILVGSNLETPLLEQPSIVPTYKLRGSVGTQGSFIGGNVAVSSNACNAGISNCGKGAVAGGFFGPTAGRAGLTFVGASDAHGTFGGAASFAQTSIATQAPTINLGNTGFYAHKDLYFQSNPQGLYGDATFKGELVTSFFQDAGDGNSIIFAHVPTSPNTYGSIGLNTESDFIGWGYWSHAAKIYTVSGASTSTAYSNLHYLIGKPTSIMPTAGTARYDFVSGSAPTLKDAMDNVTVGKIEQSSHMLTDFGTGVVTANINTKTAANATLNITGSATIAGSQFGTTSSASSVQMSGFFTGNLATRAGVVYNANTALGQLQGVAVFGRTSSSGLAN